MVMGLKDIAKAADVSVATASKALSGRDDVSPATRQRVLDVAKEMKYRPNLLVRGIQTGRTGTIGVMVPLGTDPFFGSMLRGIHDELSEEDQVPMLLWSHKDFDGVWQGPTELEQIHRLVDRRVDGIIIVPVEDAASDDYLSEIRDQQLPLVAIDRKLPNSHLADFVGTDDRAVGRVAAEHLLRLGHRRLVHIAGPDFASTARERREGFEATIAGAAGVSYRVVEEPSFTRCTGATQALLADGEPPTAIFCANDHLAGSLYPLVTAMGLAVGRDLSVIGVGDLPFGSFLWPALSSVRQNPEEIGRRAVLQLREKIAQAPEERQNKSVLLAPELVVRQSTHAI